MPVCLTHKKKLETAEEVTKHISQGCTIFYQANENIEGRLNPFGLSDQPTLIEDWMRKKAKDEEEKG
ncbi:MAG: hypothetical protein ACPL3B_01975 [Fervidobacterium sp.]